MSKAHSTASLSTLNTVIAPIVVCIVDVPMDINVSLDDEIEQIKKAAQLEEQKAAEAAEKAQQAVGTQKPPEINVRRISKKSRRRRIGWRRKKW